MNKCVLIPTEDGAKCCVNCNRKVKRDLTPERFHLICRRPADLACVHRGEKIREGKGNLCGHRGTPFEVFTCEIHGECVLRRLCRKQWSLLKRPKMSSPLSGYVENTLYQSLREAQAAPLRVRQSPARGALCSTSAA